MYINNYDTIYKEKMDKSANHSGRNNLLLTHFCKALAESSQQSFGIFFCETNWWFGLDNILINTIFFNHNLVL